MSEVENNMRDSPEKTLTRSNVLRVPDTIAFPEEEKRILKEWKAKAIFEKCMQLSKGKPK